MALVHDKEVAEFVDDTPKVTPMGRYASNLINVKYSQAIDNVQNRKFARETAPYRKQNIMNKSMNVKKRA